MLAQAQREQVAARLAQPGTFILQRPASSRAGEEQPDGEGDGEEEKGGPPLGSTGSATPGQAPSALPPWASAYAHRTTSAHPAL